VFRVAQASNVAARWHFECDDFPNSIPLNCVIQIRGRRRYSLVTPRARESAAAR
jgi:hypothetical protein